MARAAAVLLALVGVSACQKTATTAPPSRDDALVAAPLAPSTPANANAKEADAAAAIDFGPRGPLTLVPRVPPYEKGGMMDHAFAVGWSTSGETLGECHQGIVVMCDFTGLDGKKEFASVRPGEPSQSQKEKALKARAAAMGLGKASGEWAFARDLEVTWQAIVGSQTTTPPVLGVLKVGARVRGEKNTVFVIALSEKSTGYHDRIHPEAIALSPDGKYLGVVAHAYSGEYGDAFPMAIVPVARLAAEAYAAAGMSAQAAAADPTFVPSK